MKIKTKLNAGVGLLFFMIIILSVVGGWFIYQLKKDTQNILVANYNTLQYSRNMLLSLEEIDSQPFAVKEFQKNLKLQSLNITESGEKEVTQNIISHFSELNKNPKNQNLKSVIRKDIAELMQLNMNAIQIKSGIANTTAESAIAVISIAGTLCFLIAFILMINLPSNIANPIRELTFSIHQIAQQNYKERVQFEGNSEFGELAKSFNTMAEKLQEYSESRIDKILKGKKRIETLIDNMHDAVIGIDENRKVLFVNDEALKISGLKKEQFVGKQIQDVAVGNDLVRDLIREIIDPETEKKADSELLKIFVEGKENYFEKEIVDINVLPTGEDSKRFIGQVIMLRNITPFKELDLAKTHFMGTVSHEFKTPISSIQMGVQLLENIRIGELNDEQQKLVSGIKDDTFRLLKITGELLNLTQLETGVVQLNIKPTDIHEMVESVIAGNQSLADHKQITIKSHIDTDLQLVNADYEKTSWVLSNILSNAIRYSYENSEVEVKVEKDNEDEIVFSVKDHGYGIEDQYLDKVFTRYFRIPGTKSEGTGLGLSISKEFIEAQGGKISVRSEIGSGSTFYFSLKA
ncbi:HAMP domain-containing sensor histidine kinase [Chryseobacterium aquaticum]|uniref:histidine kinase n=1 Tax=Chryseobacterium aquaticum subsp. greenlandense TaxID=345663 RepID=A0A117KB84_9FLAO|nr:ATP-binding protein [Chryseobacterium aquaticum]KUJ55591.1 PAS domain-containing sensor histidine kinase [Chryseobacterium aquaticum subsp. greenlandense]